MYDLVSIGALSIDLYFQGDSLTISEGRFELVNGGKYFADFFHESLGGGATNVAIGARRHGLNVSLLTTIGDNGFRGMVEERLQKERVSYLHSNFEKNYQNISCILLPPKGDKTVINYRTPHQRIFDSQREKNALLRTKAIYMGNLTDISFTQKVEAIRFFKSNDKFVFTILGADDCRRSKEQLQQILKYTDILIVNEFEYADIIKTKVEKINFSENQFHKLGVPEMTALIITQGKKGSHGYTQEGFNFQAAIHPPAIVDSTGAGDGYCAGFISSYLKNHQMAEAMESGAKYAAKILAKIGAN